MARFWRRAWVLAAVLFFLVGCVVPFVKQGITMPGRVACVLACTLTWVCAERMVHWVTERRAALSLRKKYLRDYLQRKEAKR